MTGLPPTWHVDEDNDGIAIFEGPGEYRKLILRRWQHEAVFDVLRDLIVERDATRGRA
ncbi:hypothetical protein ACI3EY_16800 [Ornithinimicrobium sp. LYQ92]|uniref:hypothetical protein n=1 Tax=Serinicoccus sp. LYQ92 TaxID=3378798 RepID=UPI003852AD5C